MAKLKVKNAIKNIESFVEQRLDQDVTMADHVEFQILFEMYSDCLSEISDEEAKDVISALNPKNKSEKFILVFKKFMSPYIVTLKNNAKNALKQSVAKKMIN